MEWSGRDEGDNGATLMLYTSKGKKKKKRYQNATGRQYGDTKTETK